MSRPKMPKHTCPMIDEVIKSVESAMLEINGADFSDPESAGKALDNIECLLRYIPSQMEDIRSANGQLRDAAEYWEAEAERLESEVA